MIKHELWVEFAQFFLEFADKPWPKNLSPPLFGQKYKLEFAIIHLS
jgi:hypothetical protein